MSTTPAPAPFVTRALAQARFEAGILLRNGEQLLVALVLPALALVALTYASYPDLGPDRRIDVAAPGTLALAVISTAFTGQAIQTGFDRRYGVLRYLGTTPLGRSGLLVGRAGGVLVVLALQTVVLGALGLALGWHPRWIGVPAALVTLVLGAWCFVALALAFAGSMRAEAVLALANLVWVLLLGLGGVLLPVDTLPAGVSHIVRWLPSAALGDGMRAPLLHGSWPWLAHLVLIAWALIFTLWATRTFRWRD